MKKILPALVASLALVGCATDKSSDVQAPIQGGAATSSKPGVPTGAPPAAANAIPPSSGKK